MKCLLPWAKNNHSKASLYNKEPIKRINRNHTLYVIHKYTYRGRRKTVRNILSMAVNLSPNYFALCKLIQ